MYSLLQIMLVISDLELETFFLNLRGLASGTPLPPLFLWLIIWKY